jgi:aminoglycoside phosphotransferase (APT) family kinase protein
VTLAGWLGERLGEPVQVSDLHRHAEGWSWQTYTLTATGPGGRRGYAVRREPEDGLLAPYDIEAQYRLHRAVLDHSDVPMPALHWLELDRRWLGMPFYVMDRVEGVVPVQWRGKDPQVFPTPELRRGIGLAFVDVLARIHGIDWRAAGLDFLGDAAPEAQIDRWQRMYEESALLEVPVVREALGWLRRNVATSGRIALCHGDYRIGNFMLERAGSAVINAVFDWELAHLSDPVEDIAYAGLPLFRGRSPMLSQLLEPAEFFERYESLTGLRVEPAVFRFWTVLGLVKAAASHLRAVRAFESGVDDVRLAAMGHQSLYVQRYLNEVL